MVTAYVGLGSNLGERASLLREAVEALDREVGRVVARSAVFETAAVADEPQPDYLNAAVRLETQLGARALLERCLAIETMMGRLRPVGRRKASRTIDLDLLLHGNTVIDEPGLVVPHPRLLARAFVRAPLALVAEPGLRHPVSGELLDRFSVPPEVRLYSGVQL